MANPSIGIIMGSQSDWKTMRHAADVLTELRVEHELKSYQLIVRQIDYLSMLKQHIEEDLK